MDADEYNERLQTLIEMLVDLYSVIGKLFGLLPIPINIPALWDEAQETGPEDANVIVTALTRARGMLMDLPIDPHVTALLNMAIVEWLGAFDMCALADANLRTHDAGALAYRLEVVWLAVGRVTHLTEHVKEHLRRDL
ncbi:MAG TPA: hypothetical protein VFV66_19260 [Nonomuraea sp.]|nr:hypothetical protein [Nonomuraea sp.]